MAKIESGVYAIVNLTNGKRYIGSACNLERRLEDHVRKLDGGYHDNRYLQNSWNKYGKSGFELIVLEKCSAEFCIDCEQHWIDLYKSYLFVNGYNRSPTAGSILGVRFSEKTKQKMSKRMLGVPMPGWVKEKIRAALKGRRMSAEHRANLWKNRQGWTHSEVSKKKTSRTLKKLIADGKQFGWRKGQKHSKEARLKMSMARKGIPKTLEHRIKIGLANKGKKRSVETCRRISESKRGSIPWNKGQNTTRKRTAKCLI